MQDCAETGRGRGSRSRDFLRKHLKVQQGRVGPAEGGCAAPLGSTQGCYRAQHGARGSLQGFWGLSGEVPDFHRAGQQAFRELAVRGAITVGIQRVSVPEAPVPSTL